MYVRVTLEHLNTDSSKSVLLTLKSEQELQHRETSTTCNLWILGRFSLSGGTGKVW
ncbi:hypothetical protein KPLM21_90018 [Klebsiella pneumoniae]|nr:hypothetical protein KPLM21_90018 [Klebsiella pneumoniae]